MQALAIVLEPMADHGSMQRLSGLDMLDDNPLFPGPFQQLSADVFRATIDSYGARFAAPFDNPVSAPNHSFGGQGEIDTDAKPFAVEIIQHVQQTEPATIRCPAMVCPQTMRGARPVRHEVHRPGHVRSIWHRQGVGFGPFQPFAGLVTKVQFQLAVNPVNPFVVP